ncbi:homoserine kinase [Fundicoccus sp. Sow4_F4]|uniref:homoserine kinase n=1 Tax=Fundicoccus sp. Sow4_F4 TaxID=3438783 RepID=UPI003F9104F9
MTSDKDIFYCKVPATSANLGVGFDSIGLAVDKFLTIKAWESDLWQVDFEQAFLNVLPRDEANLVVQTAKAIAKQYGKELPTLHLHMASEIPLTHGLGSSSSAIVAGIELANHFADLNLTSHERILLGSQIEGHPDNIGPCVTGGLFVGYYANQEVFYQTADFAGVSLILSVPAYELSTQEARRILPQNYKHSEAAEQNAIGNVMLMAMLNGDYDTMGQMMMRDMLHEPYRQQLIEQFQPVKELALAQGAYATVISGAGPTILTLSAQDKVDQILAVLKAEVPSCDHEAVAIYRH